MRNQLCTFALTGLLTLGLGTGAVLAQDNSAPPQNEGWHGHRGGGDPAAQLQHMTKALDLSADQQSQIKPILDARQQQMQQLWQDQSISREDRRAKMQSIQQDTSSKIEAVLNDTQKQKYEAMQERRMEHRHGGAPSQESAPPQPQQ